MQDSGFEVLGRITKHSHFIVSLIKGNSFEDHSNMAYRNRKSLKLTYIDNTDVGKIRLIFIAKFLTRLKMFKRLKSLLVLNIQNFEMRHSWTGDVYVGYRKYGNCVTTRADRFERTVLIYSC